MTTGTFDPNEHPRDDHGRFQGDGVVAEKPKKRRVTQKLYDEALYENEQFEAQKDFERKKQALIKEAGDNVALALNYDPNLISVRNDAMKFQLNGIEYDYAGAAYLDTGKIELFAKQLTHASVAEVTAHEVGHQKFQSWLEAYKKESHELAEATKDLPNVKDYVNMDGTLKGDWAEKFPTYQEYTKLMMPSVTEEFSKSDGITPYSRQWWQSWHDGKAQTMQAFHETLAEMTAREYTTPVTGETETKKFKDLGFSLDYSHGTLGRPTEYRVRPWGTDHNSTYDEATLPDELKASLVKLRRFAELDSKQWDRSVPHDKKYSTPAPEWVAIYEAVNRHWDNTHWPAGAPK